jgi:sarcosine oxidase
MPDDRLRELFDRAAAEQVDVPPVEMVRARGQQRRSRARLQASTVAWTIMLAMGFGAPQVSGSLATGSQQYGEVATKIGIDGAGPVVTPQSRTYARDETRVRRVRAFLDRYLPHAAGPELYTRTCCYDFPPDRDFIAGYLPESQRVLICAGAGHAGKFAALLGRVLAEFALDGSSRYPVSAFSTTRPALSQPAHATVRVNSM